MTVSAVTKNEHFMINMVMNNRNNVNRTTIDITMKTYKQM